jgi:two-component system response regulator FixJ
MATLSRGKVLVVEDDESMREAIETLLEVAGYRSTLHLSAESMLAEGALTGNDCVISDLRLPGMSGLDLLAELRRRECLLPLILITAYDTPAVRAAAARQGVAVCLAKPFLGSELLAAVAAAVRSRPPGEGPALP